MTLLLDGGDQSGGPTAGSRPGPARLPVTDQLRSHRPRHRRDHGYLRRMLRRRGHHRRVPRWPWRARLAVAAVLSWAGFLTGFAFLTGRHWWWRPVELIPPVGFPAVSLLLLPLCPLARRVRGRLAVMVAGCLLVALDLAGLNLYALPGVGGETPAPPGAVRVFSWNTEFWTDGDDPDRFYRYLADQHADVYMLQEHIGWDVPGRRPVRIDAVPELRRRFPGYQVVAVGEMLTMSRYPVVAQRSLDSWPYLSDRVLGGPPAGSDFPEFYRYKVLRTDLRIGSETLSVYNTHIPVQLDVSMDPTSAEFSGFMRAQEVRRQAAYQALFADLEVNHAPTVVAGDLNATSAMGEVRRLGTRLRDALPAADSLYLGSWPAEGRTMWRLDWAFTGGGVRVYRYRMLPSQGLSDHRAQELVITPR